MSHTIQLTASIFIVSELTKELEEFKFQRAVKLYDVDYYNETNIDLMFESLIKQGVRIEYEDFIKKVKNPLISIKFYNNEDHHIFFNISFEEFHKLYLDYESRLEEREEERM